MVVRAGQKGIDWSDLGTTVDARAESARSKGAEVVKFEHPIFEARSGTVIRVYSDQPYASTICGYCRALVLENDCFRFVCGFRRYTNRVQSVSWAEPVEWPTAPVSQVSIRIVPEKAWMQFSFRSDGLSQPRQNS